MLEFGAEVPAHAACSSGRAVQLPVPEKWDNPEVRVSEPADAAPCDFFCAVLLLALRCNCDFAERSCTPANCSKFFG